MIHTLIRSKENRKLEFKRELPSKDKLIKTAISFSNSQGRDLIIGVDDNNRLVGIVEDDIVKFEEMISNQQPYFIKPLGKHKGISTKEFIDQVIYDGNIKIAVFDDIIEQWGTRYSKIKNELNEYEDIILQIEDSSQFTQIKLIKKTTIQKTTQKTTKELVVEKRDIGKY